MSEPAPAARARLRNFWGRLAVGAVLVALFAWLALRHPQELPGEPPVEPIGLLYREMYVLGTQVSVSLWMSDPAREAAAEAALDALARELDAYHRRWSAWGDGELGQLNQQLLAGQTGTVAEPLRALAQRAFALRAASGGRFDIRVGALVRLWGFDDPSHYRSEPPADADIAAAVAALAAAPQSYHGAASWGPAPGVAWDFGAIGKGDAISVGSQLLSAAGFPDHIINAGGNLMASGRRGERAWRVGIRDPRGDSPSAMLAALETQGSEAVVTSGDYERYFEYHGRRYHHIVDPRSGLTARGLRSVTVLHPDGAVADAGSTALFVSGTDRWRETARAMGLDQVLIVDDAGQLIATPRLAPRLRLFSGVKLQTVPLQAPP